MADLSGLSHDFPESPMPELVRGRKINIDGDILAYFCAGNDETPLGVARNNLIQRIETLRVFSGSTKKLTHITHPLSNKGHRYEIAVTQEYQKQRTHSARPKNWSGLREVLDGLAETDMDYATYRNAEADDGMSIEAWQAEPGMNVTCSADKDLRQCPGLMLDMDTLELWENKHEHLYQEWLKMPPEAQEWETRGTLGKGRLFRGVWFLLYQMLVGDNADYIPGLKKVNGDWLFEHNPDSAFISKKVRDGKEAPKDKPAGSAIAAEILGWLPSHRPSVGYAVVKAAYAASHGEDWEVYFKEQWELLCLDTDETGRASRLALARRLRDGEFDREVHAKTSA